MKRLIYAAVVVITLIFGYNLYKYKQNDGISPSVTQIARDAGADEDTVNALEDTIDTIRSGQMALSEAKQLITENVSDEKIKDIGITLTQKNPLTEDTKRELEENLKDQLTYELESLPTFTEKDIDEMVNQIVIKIQNACTEENIKAYLKTDTSVEDFNNNLSEKITDSKWGFIGSFMKRWITNMPDINDIDPYKGN